VETIYVYPTSFVPQRADDPYFAPPTVVEDVLPTLGEAHQRGPIVLAWDAVKKAGRHPERGHNLVVHEFAHKLDLLDGAVDGVPPLGSAEEYQRWSDVCRAEYRALELRAEQGRPGPLDTYGLVSPGEFFAVATEAFFDQPLALQRQHPALYEVLQNFYRQDTARRERQARQGHSD
jgi:Mlc titration factor MtfA (ptsG expression regulator)